MRPAPATLTGHCEYGANHDKDLRERPHPVAMVSTDHVEEPETCSSGSNVKLYRDCAEEAGVVDE